jgi:Na+-transporting NADH:ubiquinone oxidoreductase subunit C
VSTSYVVRFVLIMTTIVAVLLTVMFLGLKDKSDVNEAIFNKRAILAAVADHLGEGVVHKNLKDEQVQEIFSSKVEQLALDMSGQQLSAEDIIKAGYKGGKPENIDMAKEKKKPEADRILPFYVYSTDDGKYYIMSIRGNGLWDEIWGYVALEKDLSTIAGVSFDHKGETPGLGAEIKDNPAFPKQFKGEKIYDENGQYTSVKVVKGGADKNDIHGVDGLSGATVTADGVDEMLYRGLSYYEPYINQIKSSGGK